jgi:hypothetical protein
MAFAPDAGLTIITLPSGDPLPSGDSLPPLTTPFTLPTSCIDHWVPNDARSTNFVTNFIPASCYPDSATIHSPGTCIPGYRMVKLVEYRTVGYSQGGDRMWGAACCKKCVKMHILYETDCGGSPGSRWPMSSGSNIICSDMTLDTTIDAPYILCTSSFNTSITEYRPVLSTLTITQEDGSSYIMTTQDHHAVDNTTILTQGTMEGALFRVYWQASDLSRFDPDYASMFAEKVNIDFTPTTTEAILSPTAMPPSRSQLSSMTPTSQSELVGTEHGSKAGLSTGAKAGIGVGAVIGIILLCSAGFLMYRRHLQAKTTLNGVSALQNEQPEFVKTGAV